MTKKEIKVLKKFVTELETSLARALPRDTRDFAVSLVERFKLAYIIENATSEEVSEDGDC